MGRKRFRLNVQGLSLFIRAVETPEQLEEVLTRAFEEANHGLKPSRQEMEQMQECVNTIREKEGLETLWTQ
jgi:hypothetical protein